MKKARFILTEKFAHTPADLDVTPIMNLFCILIPFLLLTAVFAQTVVIDIALPPAQEGQTAQLQEAPVIPETMLQFVIINITENGLQVGTDKKVYPPVPITNWQDELDLSGLIAQLSDIKANFPDQTDAIIVSPDDMRYAVLVQLMDACINTDLGNVSLSSFQPNAGQGGQ